MSQVEKLLVFLASPGDVLKERGIVEEVIAELNRSVASEKGVVLQVVRWENDAFPGYGKDAQSIINEQIAAMANYALFVGIMWNRIGTPTPRASSGTVEEFELAKKAAAQNGRPEIWFYFREAASNLDTEDQLKQKKKVVEFRRQYKAKGMPWTYRKPADFREQFRNQITLWLNSRSRRVEVSSNESNTNEKASSEANKQGTMKKEWVPPEISWPDESTMVMLPIYGNSSTAYFISKYPITNRQYKVFVRDTKAQEPNGEVYDRKMGGWRGGFFPWKNQDFSDDLLPVVCVSYYDAKRYCKWVQTLCLDNERKFVRKATTCLPWIHIWEFAAFGTSSPTLKPEVWLRQTSRIHHKALFPAPIDTTGIRTNLLGISDLFGNVWEWCSATEESELDPYNYALAKVSAGPNVSGPHITNIGVGSITQSRYATVKTELDAELRGGSYLDDLARVRPFETASRLDDKENTRHSDLSFRICAKVPLYLLDSETIKQLSDRALEMWD
jgi:formylglycine-generating enzyme required for sulfatase activity